MKVQDQIKIVDKLRGILDLISESNERVKLYQWQYSERMATVDPFGFSNFYTPRYLHQRMVTAIMVNERLREYYYSTLKKLNELI